MSLQLTATGTRTLAADGSKYDYLFPAPDKVDSIINPDASVEETVNQMVKLVQQYNWQTGKLANLLRGKTIQESTRNIWNFIYANIQYKEDKVGVEQLRTPARSWADRKKGIDCDCMSIFASSLLTNMGIDHQFRIVKYGKPDYQHVYVIVPGSGLNGKYYVIDGVIDQYDYELEFSEKKDFSAMNGIPLQILNGPDDVVINKDEKLKDFLINQRNLIIAEPAKTINVIHFQDALRLLDFLIDNWDDAHNRASAIYEALEKEIQYHPRSKFIETIVNWFDGKVKCADIEKAAWIKSETGLGTGKNVIAEYLLAPARGAYLALLRLNMFGWADKMAPAYFCGLNDETASKYNSEKNRAAYAQAFGMTIAQQKSTRDKVLRILNKWHDTLGGNWKDIKSATCYGASKLLKNANHVPGFFFWKNFDDWGGKPTDPTDPNGINGIIGINETPPSLGIDVAAIITAASAIIVSLAPLVSTLLKPTGADYLSAGDPYSDPAYMAQLQAEAERQGYKESNTWKTIGIVTGAAAIIGGIIYLITQNKPKK